MKRKLVVAAGLCVAFIAGLSVGVRAGKEQTMQALREQVETAQDGLSDESGGAEYDG